jgi:hypothetical protein
MMVTTAHGKFNANSSALFAKRFVDRQTDIGLKGA